MAKTDVEREEDVARCIARVSIGDTRDSCRGNPVDCQIDQLGGSTAQKKHQQKQQHQGVYQASIPWEPH